MISLTTKEQHLCLLMLLYGAGMRLSEVIAIKPEHVDTQRMIIHILAAKGKKDRAVTLSSRQVEALNRYWDSHPVGEWVFEGQRSGIRASRRLRCTPMLEVRRRRIAQNRKPASPLDDL